MKAVTNISLAPCRHDPYLYQDIRSFYHDEKEDITVSLLYVDKPQKKF